MISKERQENNSCLFSFTCLHNVSQNKKKSVTYEINSYLCIVFQWKRKVVLPPSAPSVLQDEMVSLRAGCREFGTCSLFFCETFYSQTMKVYINHEKGSNPVVRNAVLWAIDRKVPTTLVFDNVVFTVETWNTFLKAMWHGLAEASKTDSGFAVRKRYPVHIVTDGGSRYSTEVWFDEECRGLRYVSLY